MKISGLNKKTSNILILCLAIIVLYGFFIEPHDVKLRTVVIKNKAMAPIFKDIKMVLLSDLHIGKSWSTALKRSLDIINEISPDIIFLTGDYVSWNGKRPDYENALRYLSKLSAPLGVYAVMGDADYTSSRESCKFCHRENSGLPQARHQVRFLRDSQVILNAGGRAFSIIGIECNGNLVPDPNVASRLVTDIPAIILSHTSLAYHPIDKNKNVLVLSGDTHGGQVFLPNFMWKMLERKDDPDHMYGLYQDKNKSLYVTSGIGTTDLPFRIGVPPEIVLLKFTE